MPMYTYRCDKCGVRFDRVEFLIVFKKATFLALPSRNPLDTFGGHCAWKAHKSVQRKAAVRLFGLNTTEFFGQAADALPACADRSNSLAAAGTFCNQIPVHTYCIRHP